MTYINIQQLTKDFGMNRGVFNLNLSIEQGTVFGFVGTNGSGKTTTLRHLMGFIQPQKGSASINGLDCWRDAALLKKHIGYIPGEIAFPEAKTGTEFLQRQAELLGIKNSDYMNTLIARLQLDPTADLKRMSKGMKQKTAIVAALMADPQVLLLDEPTTGLDPLMRNAFIEILEEEKRKGKTIFMSSHMFDEVEQICDYVALIKDGRMLDVKKMADIKQRPEKHFEITFTSDEGYKRFMNESLKIISMQPEKNRVIVQMMNHELNSLFSLLKNYSIQQLSEHKYTVADYFKSLY
jgi:ABC-2 type transport system ATP-binding protein